MSKTNDIHEELEKNMKTIIRMKLDGVYPVGDAFGLFVKENQDLLDGYEMKTSREWTSFGYQSKMELKRK